MNNINQVNNYNNNNNIVNPMDLVEVQIPPKWSITDKQLNKFQSLNPLLPPNSFNSATKSIVIPVSTPINLSPLYPFASIEKPLHFNPIHKIEKLNRETLLIETKGCNIWIKDMAKVPGAQNIELGAQLRNWNKVNNLGVVVSEQVQFRLAGIGQYRSDTAYMTNNNWNLDNQNDRETHISVHPPEFVIENRSYNPNSPNNALQYQFDKMVDWIRSGVESGVLYDGPGRHVYLYCNSAILQAQPQVQGQPQSFIHPQVAAQIATTAAVVQPPVQPNNYQTLTVQQKSLYEQQLVSYNNNARTINFNHIYYENMVTVVGHPNVSVRQVNLWNVGNPPAHPKNGPNMIVHCIGAVNGFKLDLSTVPMEYL